MPRQETFDRTDPAIAPRRVLLWHNHDPWTTSFIHGGHEYLLPTVDDDGSPGGDDRPANVHEVPVGQLADTDVDLVVLQRIEEIELAERWLGRRPGRDVPAVYLEHRAPRADVPNSRHPVADRPDLLLVHVTTFNDLMWDSGTTPTIVIEHGIPDPGEYYTGELPNAAVVINEPLRRWRVTGTDLLSRFTGVTALDLFGIGVDGVAEHLGVPRSLVHSVGDLRTECLYEQMGRRRFYLHPVRWTSLGLSLIEAMHLGMPVVGLATTNATEAVPAGAGVLSTDVDRLVAAARQLINEPDLARHMGKRAREAALAKYGLARFLDAWDRLIEQVTAP
jgi:hypothetical protein